MAVRLADLVQVEDCIEHGQLAKLLRLPETLEDFSEASIVRSVEVFLKAKEKEIKKASKDFPDEEVVQGVSGLGTDLPFSERKCFVLNIMLRQRFSSPFLQEAIRSLSFDCVLSLLKYLHFLLDKVPSVLEDAQSLPALDQVTDWLNALLDGHIQQLKLAEDAVETLQTLYDQVSLMAKWQVETKALEGALLELQKRAEKQQRNTKVGNYCIEVITF